MLVAVYSGAAPLSSADFSIIHLSDRKSCPEWSSTHSDGSPSRPARPVSCW